MSKNGYNVPYGNYKSEKFPTKEELKNMNELIKDVKFENKEYNESIETVMKKDKKNDFVYLDPPYVPENKTSFVSYTEMDFKSHKELFKKIKELKCKFVMSNSCVKEVEDEFEKFKIDKIDVRRHINSKNPGAKTQELIIIN